MESNTNASLEHHLYTLWNTYKSLKSIWVSLAQPDAVINDHMIDVLANSNEEINGCEFAYLMNHFKDILRNSLNKDQS
jgi:hypothetical protein